MLDDILMSSQLLVILSIFISTIHILCAKANKEFPSAFKEGYSKDKRQSNESNEQGGQPPGAGGPAGGGMVIKPPPPGQANMAATFDPNYQTLAGINNDDVFKNKNPVGGGANPGGGGFGGVIVKPPPPGPNKMAATFDPNYQTLAGINNDDVFKPKAPPKPAAPVPPPAAKPGGGPKMAAAFDPNYQTLAGINNDDVFKPKGGGGGGGGGFGGGGGGGGGAARNWATY